MSFIITKTEAKKWDHFPYSRAIYYISKTPVEQALLEKVLSHKSYREWSSLRFISSFSSPFADPVACQKNMNDFPLCNVEKIVLNKEDSSTNNDVQIDILSHPDYNDWIECTSRFDKESLDICCIWYEDFPLCEQKGYLIKTDLGLPSYANSPEYRVWNTCMQVLSGSYEANKQHCCKLYPIALCTEDKEWL